jgi:peptide-methionine (R)-S-oxide reductase
MNRRQWLLGATSLFAARIAPASGGESASAFPLAKSKAEWKSLLPAESYRVLFEEDTEYPGSSPLDHEVRAGIYICAACFQPLFDSKTKFDSRTGWPSFYDHLPAALGMKNDFRLLLPRTEYHCSRCGGHQGHVFEDGPEPTGLRYCNNGLSLRFVPEPEALPKLRS